MKVRVRAFAQFREIIGSEVEVEVPEGTDLIGMLARLAGGSGPVREALFDHEGTVLRHVILMVNGKRVGGKERYVLSEGDEVAVFPPVAGG